MKLFIQLVALWIALALGVGMFGGRVVEDIWRNEMEASFRRDMVAAEAMIESLSWSNPPEAQPEWRKMERELGLGIIPVQRSKAPESVELIWTQAGQEGMRLTADVALSELPETTEANTIRVTRDIQRSSLDNLWWSLWALLNLAALAIGGLTFFAVRHDRGRKKRLLRPWFQALDNAEERESLLPAVEAQDSDFCIQMDAVADMVNRIYASLKNANERSDLVLGNLREGVLAVDDRSRVLLSNRALSRLLELPNDNFLYRPLVEIIRTPAIVNMLRKILREEVLTEEQLEYGVEPRQLRILGRPLPLGAGKSGALFTVRDETLIKRVDMIKKDFVSNASHELKTPLAAIRAYAETLQMGALEDPDAAESFVNNIISQADRLDGLVQGMLQLSRVEVGSALNYQRFDVIEAIEPCINAAYALGRAKGVTIEVNAPEAAKIHSDRDGLQTIASNLLSNAVRYTEAGGKVAVHVERQSNQLILEVRDSGIGMAEEDLARIFERFYRAEKDRSIDTGGTGLGLAIVKHLTGALGGSVAASSELGKGSCFVVELPNEPLGNVE